jgi:hypothetical protein
MSSPARRPYAAPKIQSAPLRPLLELRDKVLEADELLEDPHSRDFDANVEVPADVWNRIVGLALEAK